VKEAWKVPHNRPDKIEKAKDIKTTTKEGRTRSLAVFNKGRCRFSGKVPTAGETTAQKSCQPLNGQSSYAVKMTRINRLNSAKNSVDTPTCPTTRKRKIVERAERIGDWLFSEMNTTQLLFYPNV